MYVFFPFLSLSHPSPSTPCLTQSPWCVVLDAYDVWCIMNVQSKGVWARLGQAHLLPEMLQRYTRGCRYTGRRSDSGSNVSFLLMFISICKSFLKFITYSVKNEKYVYFQFQFPALQIFVYTACNVEWVQIDTEAIFRNAQVL